MFQINFSEIFYSAKQKILMSKIFRTYQEEMIVCVVGIWIWIGAFYFLLRFWVQNIKSRPFHLQIRIKGVYHQIALRMYLLLHFFFVNLSSVSNEIRENSNVRTSSIRDYDKILKGNFGSNSKNTNKINWIWNSAFMEEQKLSNQYMLFVKFRPFFSQQLSFILFHNFLWSTFADLVIFISLFSFSLKNKKVKNFCHRFNFEKSNYLVLFDL